MRAGGVKAVVFKEHHSVMAASPNEANSANTGRGSVSFTLLIVAACDTLGPRSKK